MKPIIVIAAFSFGIAQPFVGAAECVAPLAQPVAQVRLLETQVDQDVVYSPIRNEVITRVPVSQDVVAPLDTLKAQVFNRLNSGLVTGAITETEAARIDQSIDTVANMEAQFKLAGLTDGHINNLMRRYNMINQSITDLSSNTATNDYMPGFENRRDVLMRRILYHVAANNLTAAEGEQLLTALNNITDSYARARATGNVVTADELENLHKDMFALQNKLGDRVGALIAKVVPESHFQRTEHLKRIQSGLASKKLSADEGAKLIAQYNRLVLLEEALAANNGVRSAEIKQLADEISNLNFILDRELRDRTVAGSSTRF